jgi:hypothetical protein
VEVLAALSGGGSEKVADGQKEERTSESAICLKMKNIINANGRLIRIIFEAHSLTFVYGAY